MSPVLPLLIWLSLEFLSIQMLYLSASQMFHYLRCVFHSLIFFLVFTSYFSSPVFYFISTALFEKVSGYENKCVYLHIGI